MKSYSLRNQTQDFIEHINNKTYFFYLIKCLIGAIICFSLYIHFPKHQFHWAIVSVLLVLAVEDRDSIKFSVDRIKANIIGASVGLLFFMINQVNIFTLLLSILFTILLCTFLKLGVATRTSLAGLIIVLIQEKERNTWEIAFERMASVLIGCLVALMLTFVFLFLNRTKQSTINETEAAD